MTKAESDERREVLWGCFMTVFGAPLIFLGLLLCICLWLLSVGAGSLFFTPGDRDSLGLSDSTMGVLVGVGFTLAMVGVFVIGLCNLRQRRAKKQADAQTTSRTPSGQRVDQER